MSPYSADSAMSPLHRFLGLVGDDRSGTLYAGDVVIFSIRRKREKICCPICRSLNVVFRNTVSKGFNAIPTGLKRVFLVPEVQLLSCWRYGQMRQIDLGLVDTSSFTQTCVCEIRIGSVETYDHSACGPAPVLSSAHTRQLFLVESCRTASVKLRGSASVAHLFAV